MANPFTFGIPAVLKKLCTCKYPDLCF